MRSLYVGDAKPTKHVERLRTRAPPSWLVPEEHLPPRLARDDKEDKWAGGGGGGIGVIMY